MKTQNREGVKSETAELIYLTYERDDYSDTVVSNYLPYCRSFQHVAFGRNI